MIHRNVFLGLGSNLGDRLGYLTEASRRISCLPETDLECCSSVYETDPVGAIAQNRFLNMVIEIATNLPPQQMMSNLHEIERDLGRLRTIRWGPRTIDIDILCWGAELISTPALTIPHPEIAERRFVLAPLAEIAADLQVPPHFHTVRDMLESLSDTSSLELSVPRSEFQIF